MQSDVKGGQGHLLVWLGVDPA